MSQVNSAGSTLTNNITPWSRTPGKPGVNTGVLGPFSSNRWQSSNKLSTSNSTDLPATKREVTHLEDLNSDFDSFSGISEASHMWPSPVFDASRVTDSSAFPVSQSEGISGSNQWSVSPFLGNSNSLLGAPGASTGSSFWPIRSTDVPTAVVPRAITGQQQLMLTSSATPGGDPNRRFHTGGIWPTGAESSDLLADDRSGLSLSLSKMCVTNAVPPGSCFQPISDYTENQLGSSTSAGSNLKSLDSLADMGQKPGKKTSIESAEVDALLASDPEESIRSVVSTSDPWGLNPVDQSTPWDVSELTGEPTQSAVSCASPSAGDAANSTNNTVSSSGRASGLFDTPTSLTGGPRRIGPSSTSASNTVLESNVWPSEPPNGTGIWESHYESLGERTARWQQNTTVQFSQGSGAFNSQLSTTPHSHHPGFLSGTNQPGSRAALGQLQSGADGAPLFRGFNRPTPGLFPNASAAGANLGTRPVLGATPSGHQLGASIHGAQGAGAAARGFPLNSAPGLAPSGSWSFQSGPGAPELSTVGNKSRWPSSGGFGRLTGKGTHNTPHMVANQAGNNVRWPISNTPHVPTGWPLNDPRRPNLMQSASTTGPGATSSGPGASGWSNDAAFFGQAHPNLAPTRMNQPDFPSPLVLPHPRVTGSGTGVIPTGQQAFRTPHSALYSTNVSAAFPPSCSAAPGANVAATAATSSGSANLQPQRLFLSPQQHSHQLQQQSVLRANAMRQLVNLGFPEDEVQAIFSDINTNVERALIDLRDRTCHPGLDEMIKSFTNSGLMHIGSGLDESLCSDMSRSDLISGPRPLTLRMTQQNAVEPQLSKSGPVTPTDNLELSLQVLQQRETQILQTIMQLHSKHQELNQKLGQIRSTNMPFATNSVLQELQLQAFQVAQQIDAQHAQLKHVRSQVGMLKQITVTSTSANPTPGGIPTPLGATNFPSTPSTTTTPTSAFNLLTPPTVWQSVGPGLGMDADSLASDPSLNPHEVQGLKMGSGTFLWEPGPWSGSRGTPASSDLTGSSVAASSASDRRWPSASAAYPARHPFTTYTNFSPLVDPIWAELGETKLSGSSTDAHQSPSATGTVDPTDSTHSDTTANVGLNRAVATRSWILVHNIPPHVAVGTLKASVSVGLTNYYQEQGIETQQPDFELHPNMSARWVLLGFSTNAESTAIQDYLENAGGSGGATHGGHGSGHYGAVKSITPSDALLRLQDIQSLASRIKGLGTEGNSTMGAGPQSGSVLNYVNPSASSPTEVSNTTSAPDSASANQAPGDKL